MIIGRRRSRVVGAIWALVGVALVAAGILLWLDKRVVSFELPAAPVALALAWSWWRQHAILDRHGIATVRAFGERRVLWASVDRVEVRRRAWFRPAIVLHLKGSGTTVPVPASSGLRRRQRNRLLEFMTDVARQHGFDVVAATGEPLAGPGAAMDDVRERVLASAGSSPTFASTTPAASSPVPGAVHPDPPVVSGAVTDEADVDPPRRPTPLDAGPGRGEATTSAPVVDRQARMPSWLRDGPDDPDDADDAGVPADDASSHDGNEPVDEVVDVPADEVSDREVRAAAGAPGDDAGGTDGTVPTDVDDATRRDTTAATGAADVPDTAPADPLGTPQADTVARMEDPVFAGHVGHGDPAPVSTTTDDTPLPPSAEPVGSAESGSGTTSDVGRAPDAHHPVTEDD